MAKVYGDAGNVILEGLKNYASEVQNGSFPQPENWFKIKDQEYDELLDLLD
jgi:ketopantoate hydroxymethyltransferase